MTWGFVTRNPVFTDWVVHRSDEVTTISSMRKISVLRGGVGAAVAALTIVAGAANVSASGDYPLDPTPAISPESSTQAAGASFTETVSDCEVGEIVTFTFEGQTVNETCMAPADIEAVTTGTAVASLAAPGLPGTYTGNAFLQTSNVNLQFEVIVDGDTGVPSLPPTGSETNQIVPVAVGLVVFGAALVGVAATRRRRELV